MGKRQNVIELNGKHYDVATGRLIASTTELPQPKHHNPVNTTLAPSIDGITKRRRSTPGQTINPTIKKPAQPHKHAQAVAAHNVHHGKVKTTRSKTLMRSTVSKPHPGHPVAAHNPVVTAEVKPHIPTQAATHRLVPNPDRLQRAQHIAKSRQVSKFGDIAPGVTKRVASLDVQPAPHTENMHHTPVKPFVATQSQPDPLEAINPFDLALEKSLSHEQPKVKKPSLRHRAASKLRVSPKAFNIAAGVFVTLFIGGLFAYRNLPDLAMKLASTRAGVNASLPDYRPAGFSLAGPVQYNTGAVTLNYQSNSDDRNFQIIQKSSDWNSQSLLESFVAEQEPYQTFQDKGRTIYIYRGSNATWVNGGVWYQIEGESDLTSDQLLRIVSSL